ncbi:MAG: recombinase family protein [Sedimenticola sp.]
MKIAAYARYSSDNQRVSSIQDQIRNCQNFCEKEGWPSPVIYQDAAISGSRSDRPEYNRMLDDARDHRFNVLLVDDLSRLSRVNHETSRVVELLKFWGIRLIGVADGVDTDQKGYAIHTGVRGIVNSIYLDDLAEKTHRGLMGQALQGQSAGGKSYGYDSVPVQKGSEIIGYQKVINQDEAEWVRFCFERYAAGVSVRQIADELNRKGVPSPRNSTWAHSALYGDMKRGLGMLNNAMYVGQYIWNRSKWIKDPVSGKRKRVERPESEWVIQEIPELRIVDQETWNKVKARQNTQRQKSDELKKRHGKRTSGGRGPKYLLSGLLKCSCCGGNYVIVGKDYYGCATHKDRGASVCNNKLKVRRGIAEKVILMHIKEELLSEEAYHCFITELEAELKAAAPDTRAIEKRLHQAEQELENIMSAIRQGIITPTTKEALEIAEKEKMEIAQVLEEAKQYQPLGMIPEARKKWKKCVKDLEQISDVPRVRHAVKALLGDIPLFPNEEKNCLEAALNQGALMAALGSLGEGFGRYSTIPYVTNKKGLIKQIDQASFDVNISEQLKSSLTLVAGVGFEPTTFGL